MIFIRNFKIATRLFFIAFAGVIVGAVITIVSCTSLYRLSYNTTRAYDTISVSAENLIGISNAFDRIGPWVGKLYSSADVESNTESSAAINTAIAYIEQKTNEYLNTLNDNGISSGDEYNNLKKIADILPAFKTTLQHIVADGATTNSPSSFSDAEEQLTPITLKVAEAIQALEDIQAEQSIQVNQDTAGILRTSFMMVVVTFLLGTLSLMVIALLVRKSIIIPLRELAQASVTLAQGNVNIEFQTNFKDEVGEVSRGFATVASTIKTFVADLNTNANELDAGDIDSRIDIKKYSGEFEKAAIRVNLAHDEFIQDMLLLIGALQKIGDGDFNIVPKVLPGKKIVLTNTVNEVLLRLKTVDRELNNLIGFASQGELQKRAEAKTLSGGWEVILDGLNALLDAVAEPINECSEVLREVSKGNLKVSVKGDYKGSFLLIKNDLNTTTEGLSSYIAEIANVLNELSADNFHLQIERPYVGDFSAIKESLNKIIDRLNYVLWNINAATVQVSSGARQISDSSMNLAQGAMEQSGSVQALGATIEAINNKAKTNALSAKKANSLSNTTKENAKLGNQEMHSMLKSINDIKASSKSISSIIKVIDDIAFQTNLLAINAAVEAARAGTRGKGFATVADEVRNLATKSQKAAKETTIFIEDSIVKVEEGTRIAQETADSLSKIVGNIEEVSTIVGIISNACLEQEMAVEQISVGLSQISQVVQANTAISEETASSSQELSSQSELLKAMVSSFRLRS